MYNHKKTGKENEMRKQRLLIFASGTATGGGSGFENLVRKAWDGVLNAHIAGVVSHHKYGGVRMRADLLGVPFVHFEAPWSADRYRGIARAMKADFFALSGWLKQVAGLPPERTMNIHPGPLPAFGGNGMYGHHVHEAVIAAFARDEVTHTEICMHFVTEEYDRGPIFFRLKIPLRNDDTAETLAARVNALEHTWQPVITDMVVNRKIIWYINQKRSNYLILPAGYTVEHSMS